MVNIVIYLNTESEAKQLVADLLHAKLIANGSIDINNISYRLENEKLLCTVNNVVTVQTKSLLFHDIEKVVMDKLGSDVPIYCVPIINSNEAFDSFIRNNTKKI